MLVTLFAPYANLTGRTVNVNMEITPYAPVLRDYEYMMIAQASMLCIIHCHYARFLSLSFFAHSATQLLPSARIYQEIPKLPGQP